MKQTFQIQKFLILAIAISSIGLSYANNNVKLNKYSK